MDKLVLDTMYLLPLFGIKIKLKDYDKLFPLLLKNYTVLYNPVSVIEAEWIILKLCKKNPSKKIILLEAFREGLKALLNSNINQTILTNSTIEKIADDLLLKAEIEDYFDRVIYATATYYHAILLTEDKELLEINHKDLPRPKKIISWNTVIRMF